MASYEFWLTDDSGRRITLLKNIAFASISRSIMGFGTCHVGLPFRDFNVYPAFLPDRRVEVWRAPKHGATMRREGSFFLRKYNVYTREEDNVDIIEFYGRSPLDILRRQHVSSTTLADYSKTDNIDDMMKQIVDENFITPPQTAPSGELSADGTQALGSSVSHTFFGQNVLDILKELRDISFSLNEASSSNRRIYFDVVEGAPLSGGGFGYIFRTYADQRGTDRTGGVIFSVANGNLRSPSYYEDYLDSFTIASILNFGTPAANGSAESPDSTLSRWNDIVSAQQSSEATAALNDSKANDHLQSGKSDRAFNATFVDSPGSDRQPRSLYGVDWDLGDILRVRYANKDFNIELATVYISVNEKGEENIVGLSSSRIITPGESAATCVDDYAPYTVALLHMDGADASTTFTDESGKVWTRNGDPVIDTAQSVFGGASALFDGTGDYLTAADSADWHMSTGDVTVDCWIRTISLAANPAIFANSTDGNNQVRLYILSTGEIVFDIYSGGVLVVTMTSAAGAITNGQWYHVALVRSGNNWNIYKDGVSIASVTDADAWGNYTGSFYIGGGHAGSLLFTGWIDEFRVSKGVARWTSNFTPPALAYCDP